jgi:hypothetical protein
LLDGVGVGSRKFRCIYEDPGWFRPLYPIILDGRHLSYYFIFRLQNATLEGWRLISGKGSRDATGSRAECSNIWPLQRVLRALRRDVVYYDDSLLFSRGARRFR